jgi:hypothetical protein
MRDEHLGWRWPALGLAGSLVVASAGSGLQGGGAGGWWYRLHFPFGHTTQTVVFYAGMAVLCAAWLGLGQRLQRSPRARPAGLIKIGVVWALPLLAGPVLFSQDVYSYLAQGTILHLGLSPYHDSPLVLARFHQTHVIDAVAPFWRATTAPYGPLFVGLVSLIVGVVGSNLILGVLALRLLDLAGLGLLAVYLPRLARALGADPSRATWLAVISPLVLLELVSAGHNDAVMIGLLVAGVTLAVERRPLLGIAVCAIAATIKLPAAAGIVFIAVAWARDEPDRAPRIAAMALAVAAPVFVAVSLATGLEFGWVSSRVFSTPAKVRLAITPVTNPAWTLRRLLHGVGINTTLPAIEAVLGRIALALTAGLALLCSYRARYENLAYYLGGVLLVLVLTGPATWPWYLTWCLAFLAACPGPQRSRVLVLLIAASVFLVKPGGNLAIPLPDAPFVLGAYVLAGLAVWRHGKRRGADTAQPPCGPQIAEEPPLITTPELTR